MLIYPLQVRHADKPHIRKVQDDAKSIAINWIAVSLLDC